MKSVRLVIPLVALAGGLALFPQVVGAQAAPAATPAPATVSAGLWKCQLPGGTYEVAVRSILAVSSHEYVVDNAARVTEVNIDTAGSLLARFYFLEPNVPTTGGIGATLLERGQALLAEGATKAGADSWQKVVKSYPTTTHARTVEYRLETKEQLQALFTSVETAFRLGRGGAYNVAAPAGE